MENWTYTFKEEEEEDEKGAAQKQHGDANGSYEEDEEMDIVLTDTNLITNSDWESGSLEDTDIDDINSDIDD